MMNKGRPEKLSYSFSRWTDVPLAKWEWFQEQLDQGWFIGFDPRTAFPGKWSLAPEDTYGLVFWTKDPTRLILEAERLKRYPLVIHVTLTGWEEVEKGAPDIERGIFVLGEAVKAFGPENVVWRFSPVPLVEDSVERFEYIAAEAEQMGLKEVFLSFLQQNDLMPETRAPRVRLELMKQMAARAHGLQVRLCAEDQSVTLTNPRPENLWHGVCESGRRFTPDPDSLYNGPPTEGCGCALAVDPFTVNESCTLGCKYCYAADKDLSPRKRNTTKRALKVLP